MLILFALFLKKSSSDYSKSIVSAVVTQLSFGGMSHKTDAYGIVRGG